MDFENLYSKMREDICNSARLSASDMTAIVRVETAGETTDKYRRALERYDALLSILESDETRRNERWPSEYECVPAYNTEVAQ